MLNWAYCCKGNNTISTKLHGVRYYISLYFFKIQHIEKFQKESCTSYWALLHPYFVFGTQRVQISTRTMITLTEVFRGFYQASRQFGALMMDTFLRNIGNHIEDCMASKARRRRSTFSPPWERQISYTFLTKNVSFQFVVYRSYHSTLFTVWVIDRISK
jgi:hypothetical protein